MVTEAMGLYARGKKKERKRKEKGKKNAILSIGRRQLPGFLGRGRRTSFFGPCASQSHLPRIRVLFWKTCVTVGDCKKPLVFRMI
jgi:hypothetical protein